MAGGAGSEAGGGWQAVGTWRKRRPTPRGSAGPLVSLRPLRLDVQGRRRAICRWALVGEAEATTGQAKALSTACSQAHRAFPSRQSNPSRRARLCEGSVRRARRSLGYGSVSLRERTRVPPDHHPQVARRSCNRPWLSLHTPGACGDPMVPGSAAELAWAGAWASSFVVERGSRGREATHTGTHRAF